MFVKEIVVDIVCGDLMWLIMFVCYDCDSMVCVLVEM